MARLYDYLTIIAWNIWVGTGVHAARQALRDFTRQHKPEIIALMEASNLYGDLEGLGYEVVHMRPKPLRKGNQPGQGNIALLVRKDVEIVRRKALRMRRFWIGPKHGWPQDPRVYRWVLIKWEGRLWKVMAAHTPFGEAARTESRWKLVRWLKAGFPGRPTVLVIDANMRLGEFRDTIATPSGAKATGTGIDLEAHKNCRLAESENLGKGPSDHPAKLYQFIAKRRRRRNR